MKLYTSFNYELVRMYDWCVVTHPSVCSFSNRIPTFAVRCLPVSLKLLFYSCWARRKRCILISVCSSGLSLCQPLHRLSKRESSTLYWRNDMYHGGRKKIEHSSAHSPRNLARATTEQNDWKSTRQDMVSPLLLNNSTTIRLVHILLT